MDERSRRHFRAQFGDILLIGLTFLFGGGCASLPDVSKMMAQVPVTGERPRIESARGLLSAEENAAVMRRLEEKSPETEVSGRHVEVMEWWNKEPFTSGNKVTLLVDGEATHEAMLAAVESAKDHINMETYILRDDDVGHRFAELLMEKRAEGVQVNIIYDPIGAWGTPKAFFKRLRKCGVNVAASKPIIFRGRPRIRLDHRKILVVDGRVAITGGVNVSMAQWLEEPVGNEVEASKGVPWRDTNVQIEGPAVAQVQRLFVDNWRQYAGCEPVNGDYFPQPKEEGDTLVRIAANSPGKCNRLTFLMYVSAISSARKSVHLTAGYFIPDEQVICALSEAARRGVDVKIVVAAASDSSLMLNAVRANYSRLMKAGVKFYERRDVALHAKTAVIDGVWVTVGSTNMDYWSFLNNDEINAEMLDGEFAAKMEAMFADDIGQSDEVRAEEWEKRSWGRRFNEWYSHLFAYWL